MQRRKDSKMNKQRSEEEDIDQRLKDAGLYEDGLPLDMKRAILQCVLESCQSARQEEEDRKQLIHNEQQILEDTITKFNKGGAKKHQKAEADESGEESSEEIVALLPDEKSDPLFIPQTPSNQSPSKSSPEKQQRSLSSTPNQMQQRSLSSTPDQLQQRSLSSTPNSMQQRSVSSTPNQMQQRNLSNTPNQMQQKIQSSSASSQQKDAISSLNWDFDNDLFPSDSSSSQQWRSSRRRLQLNETSSSDSQAGEVKQKNYNNQEVIMESPEEASSSLSFPQMRIDARKPLRQDSNVDNTSSDNRSPSPMLSQPMFSSCGSDGSWRAVQEEVDSLLMTSPIAGNKKSTAGTSVNSLKTKSVVTSLQEATITSSPQGKIGIQKPSAERMDGSNDDDDGVDFLPPTPESSRTYNRKSLVSDMQPVNSRLIIEALPVDKTSQQTSSTDDDVMLGNNLQGVNFSLARNFYKPPAEQEKDSPDLTDAEEEFTFTRKQEKKLMWNINVFCPEINPSVPMKRGVVKQEDPTKAYMNHGKESYEECRQRILDLINQQLQDILEHQTKKLTRKLKWSAPITIDRRLKNTLDRPRVNSRQQCVDQDQPRRAQRLALKEPRDVQSMDDLLPDINSVDDGWIEVQSKRQSRKKGRQIGLTRLATKAPKQVPATPEGKEDDSSHSRAQKLVDCNSDDDLDDFDIFPSKLSTQRKNEVGSISNKQKEPQMSMSSFAVSSSVSSSASKKKMDLENNLEVMNAECQLNESEVINLEKMEDNSSKSLQLQPEKLMDKQPQASTSKSSDKRAPRKTFMLPSPSSNKGSSSSSSSSISLTTFTPEVPRDGADEQRLLTPQPSTSSADPSDLDKSKPSQSGIRNWISKTPQSTLKQTSVGKNDALSFVSSSGIKEEAVGSNNMEDICILDEDGSGPSLAKYARREPRRARGTQQEPIRPPPVKLKKNLAKNTDNVGKPGEASESRGQSSNQAPQALAQSVNSQESKIEKLEVDDDEKMACPICQQLYPLLQIEVHASDCTGLVEESQPVERERPGVRGRGRGRKRGFKRKNQYDIEVEEVVDTSEPSTSSVNQGRVAAGHLKCEMCKEVFAEGNEILLHVQSCRGMRDIENNIMSPAARMMVGGEAGSSRQSRGSINRGGQAGGKQGLRGKEELQTGSLFDHLEGLLEFHSGDITEPKYCQPETALVQIINCVAVRPHGLSQFLADSFPYCDSYSRRRAVGNLNRAVVRDRPQQGSIKVCRPNHPNAPIVINVCGQFYMGKEFIQNIYAKKIANQSQGSPGVGKSYGNKNIPEPGPDNHLHKGLLEDTAANRIRWFREGLAQLSKSIPNDINVTQVVFPSGIGSGMAGGNWLCDYLPSIKYFASQMKTLGVKVTIVSKTKMSDSVKREAKMSDSVKKGTKMSDCDIARQGTLRQTKIQPKKYLR